MKSWIVITFDPERQPIRSSIIQGEQPAIRDYCKNSVNNHGDAHTAAAWRILPQSIILAGTDPDEQYSLPWD